jgi:hypothetical protein
MGEKERTLTERVRDVANSPTGQRVVRGIADASGAGVERELIERAKRTWKGRKKGKERRSSGR